MPKIQQTASRNGFRVTTLYTHVPGAHKGKEHLTYCVEELLSKCMEDVGFVISTGNDNSC